MALNGRINIDVLFHDTDGTASLKVVSLEDSTEYTTGKVAVVTGTCGTDVVTAVQSGATSYKDSSGNSVTFSAVQRCAIKCSGSSVIVYDNTSQIICSSGVISVFEPAANTITCNTFSGTASYTLVLYGT